MTVVRDNFDRGDSTNVLGNALTGQAWSVLSGTWGISSNQAAEYNTGDGLQRVAVIDSGDSDCTVQAKVTNLETGSGNCGLTFRCTDNNNYWRLILDNFSGSIILQKKVAGVYSTVATYAAYSPGVLAVALAGNSIASYLDWTLLGSATDSFNASATKHGLHSSPEHFPSHVPAARWDNFAVAVNTWVLGSVSL